jgi:hypothetical protein
MTEYKLKVKDAITLLDREQGGPQNVTDHDVTLHRFLFIIFLIKRNAKRKIPTLFFFLKAS